MSNQHAHPIFQQLFDSWMPPAENDSNDGQWQAQAEPQPCNAIVNLMVGGYMREARLLEEASQSLHYLTVAVRHYFRDFQHLHPDLAGPLQLAEQTMHKIGAKT